MSNVYRVTGELTDGRHLLLDATVPLPAGKVIVTLEPEVARPKSDYHELERQFRARQAARGHIPPTAEGISAYLKAERDSMDG